MRMPGPRGKDGSCHTSMSFVHRSRSPGCSQAASCQTCPPGAMAAVRADSAGPDEEKCGNIRTPATAQVRLMRFRMFRELKLMVLGLFSGLRALCASAFRDLGGRLWDALLMLPASFVG